MRNVVLFEGAGVQMAPRASGKNRDVISSMGLAAQRNRGRIAVNGVICRRIIFFDITNIF
jgi:hypothetical protein